MLSQNIELKKTHLKPTDQQQQQQKQKQQQQQSYVKDPEQDARDQKMNHEFSTVFSLAQFLNFPEFLN